MQAIYNQERNLVRENRERVAQGFAPIPYYTETRHPQSQNSFPFIQVQTIPSVRVQPLYQPMVSYPTQTQVIIQPPPQVIQPSFLSSRPNEVPGSLPDLIAVYIVLKLNGQKYLLVHKQGYARENPGKIGVPSGEILLQDKRAGSNGQVTDITTMENAAIRLVSNYTGLIINGRDLKCLDKTFYPVPMVSFYVEYTFVPYIPGPASTFLGPKLDQTNDFQQIPRAIQTAGWSTFVPFDSLLINRPDVETNMYSCIIKLSGLV